MHADKYFVVDSMPRIAALQGGASGAVQATMRRFANRWADRGTRIVGLIETADPGAAQHRRTGRLESLGSGETFPLFQNLGSMATACHLDAASVVAACAAVCSEIRRGCDLVVLNKFGKLEACRSGLADAFALAAERDIPILTAVSPTYQAAWEAYAGSLSLLLPPDDLVLDGWWRAMRDEASQEQEISRNRV